MASPLLNAVLAGIMLLLGLSMLAMVKSPHFNLSAKGLVTGLAALEPFLWELELDWLPPRVRDPF